MSSGWAYVRGEKEINKDRTRNGGYKKVDELLTVKVKHSTSMKTNWRLYRENLKHD